MRDIIFRGKDTLSDIWVEGSLLVDADVKDYHIQGFRYYSTPEGLQREPFSDLVIPETVGQYTGWLDKKSKMVFEGDIVEYWQPGVDDVGVIKWSQATAKFVLVDKLGVAYSFNDCVIKRVVGNTYDNPELFVGAT